MPARARYLAKMAAWMSLGLVVLLACGCDGGDETARKTDTDAASAPPSPWLPVLPLPSMRAQLDARRQLSAQKLPAETRAVMDAAAADLAASGLAENALNVGDAVPDFTLPDANDQVVRLADRLADGPVVLAFYRGGWCPYCNIELCTLARCQPIFASLGGQLIAISPERPEHARETKLTNELPFTVLSDVGNVVARQFGLVFALPEKLRSIYADFGINLPARNGDDSFELPVPATYVIDRRGIIRYAFVDTDYTRRAEVTDILNALQQLSKQ